MLGGSDLRYTRISYNASRVDGIDLRHVGRVYRTMNTHAGRETGKLLNKESRQIPLLMEFGEPAIWRTHTVLGGTDTGLLTHNRE